MLGVIFLILNIVMGSN